MADERLENVVDMDCIVSTNPLTFDLTSAFVQGPRAILHRIVARWNQLLGFVSYAPDMGIPTPLIDIDGATFSRADLAGLRAQLTKQAKEEDFVTQAAVVTTLSEQGLLTVNAVITMTDGGNYPLEVQAVGAVNQLGGTRLSAEQIADAVAFFRVTFGA